MFRLILNFIRRNINWTYFAEAFPPHGGNALQKTTTDTDSSMGLQRTGISRSTSSTLLNSSTQPSQLTQSTYSSTSNSTPGSTFSAVNSTGTFVNNSEAPPIIVYTDGSCLPNYASGIGVYFGPNHPLNLSATVRDHQHDSGLAEITAAITALKALREWRYYKGEAVILRTDYLPLIYAMNNDGFNGRFHEKYLQLKQLASRFPKGVQFEHVFSHEGEQGNEKADELAYQAVMNIRTSRSHSAPPFRDASCHPASMQYDRWSRRSRSRSRSRKRSRSKRVNSADHRRSHSAYIPGQHFKHKHK